MASLWGRFWEVAGLRGGLLGTPWRLKIAKMRPKMVKMRANMFKMRPKMVKMRPKMPKMRAKMTKKTPEMAKMRPKIARHKKQQWSFYVLLALQGRKNHRSSRKSPARHPRVP